MEEGRGERKGGRGEEDKRRERELLFLVIVPFLFKLEQASTRGQLLRNRSDSWRVPWNSVSLDSST